MEPSTIAVKPSSGVHLDGHTLPDEVRILTLNCWGLKYISQHRHARLVEIGRQIAAADPPPNIVGLQECWTQEDYTAIRALTKHILPYGKFYFSGIFGGGLIILTKWPVEESSMYRYPLNGRPSAFWRGDWYVGKGVACASIRIGPGAKHVVEVFNTHLHAPYASDRGDSYACHRVAQAWEIAKLMRHAADRGHLVVGLGDFNLEPESMGHQIIEACSPVRDAWTETKAYRFSDSARCRRTAASTVEECLVKHGTTCDSLANTWRWSKQMRKDLTKGHERALDSNTMADPNAKRLDYVFTNAQTQGWQVVQAEVGMTMRHPTLQCSLSDHFSVEVGLEHPARLSAPVSSESSTLPTETYDRILELIASYTARERSWRRWRLTHFVAELAISIACLVAVWWSPYSHVAFILMLISTLGLSAGVLDGLMGGLFVSSEIRALKEFEWEIENARKRAADTVGGEKSAQERRLRVLETKTLVRSSALAG
ncbi:hypothetical protein BAUCODRAFT_506706 [Baudoinia panamericana UAMH 10762]|uniref:Endonuclease/exonuclease/phosphatase domain-containing protein n=1 Tax=Baudoinia panamericana (strain UAMH 10762) TaxID=717646 RepID=M2LND3_BAUPA|nr:uncharacterized protein BAUCODRAFT_506706 [Baudoinia panamericana UAMH 10762]EMC95862.1 hypothetical protein BAUCODRAFT_506706 [Baudoinia panamericana UAMH 10762]